MRQGKVGTLAVLTIAGACCLFFARAGFTSYFTDDDLMNLYMAWRIPVRGILFDNVLFFSPAYRPMGTLAYRALFGLTGFHPAGFRIACFALMLLNLGFIYHAAAAIAKRDAALVAVLIAAYNPAFIDLYYNSGTIYDLLCGTFYFAGLSYYIRARLRHEALGIRSLAVVIVLYVCALNSKEMAVTFPVVIGVWELLFGGPLRLKAAAGRWAPCIICGLITVPYVLGKFSKASPLVGNHDYELHPGFKAYFAFLSRQLAMLAFHHFAWFRVTKTMALVAAAIALALALKNRAMLFGALFVLLTTLPVAFIAERGGYVMYIPMLGIAIYLGSAILMAARHRTALAVIVTAAVLIMLDFNHPLPPDVENLNRTVVQQIANLHPPIRHDSRVLFLDDPFPRDTWNLLYIIHLYYRSRDITVDRVKRAPELATPGEFASHQIVFGMRDGRVALLKPTG